MYGRIVKGRHIMKSQQPDLVGMFLVLDSTDHEHYRIGYIAAAVGNGDAPDFVEVGEAGIAVDHAMRRQRAVQHSW